MNRGSGLLVETKKGKIGRTYYSKGLINGKLPVYIKVGTMQYLEKAILCDPETVKHIGYVD